MSHTPPPAGKKKHGARNAILAVVGAILVIIVVAAIAGPKDQAATLPTTPTVKAPAAPVTAKPTKAAPPAPAADPDKVTVTVGHEFTVGSGNIVSGKYTVLSGWTVTSEYGVPMLTGKVKNADDDKAGLPNLQIKFANGSDLVMAFTCTANELEPGQTTKLNCFSSDDYTKKWKTVTAETGL